MLKKTYSCDICDRVLSRDLNADQLFGLRFRNNTDFVIGSYRDTDGKHICIFCLGLLKKGGN